jgi:hypothetical protein
LTGAATTYPAQTYDSSSTAVGAGFTEKARAFAKQIAQESLNYHRFSLTSNTAEKSAMKKPWRLLPTGFTT